MLSRFVYHHSEHPYVDFDGAIYIRDDSKKAYSGTYCSVEEFYSVMDPTVRYVLKTEKPQNGIYSEARVMKNECLYGRKYLRKSVITGDLESTTEPRRVFQEFVPGMNLSEYPFHSVTQFLKIFGLISAAIQEMHANNDVHGDISERNIRIEDTDAGPVVKLIDFGMTRPCGANTIGRRASYQPQTLEDEAPAESVTDLLSYGSMMSRIFKKNKLVGMHVLGYCETISSENHISIADSASIPENIKRLEMLNFIIENQHQLTNEKFIQEHGKKIIYFVNAITNEKEFSDMLTYFKETHYRGLLKHFNKNS